VAVGGTVEGMAMHPSQSLEPIACRGAAADAGVADIETAVAGEHIADTAAVDIVGIGEVAAGRRYLDQQYSWHWETWHDPRPFQDSRRILQAMGSMLGDMKDPGTLAGVADGGRGVASGGALTGPGAGASLGRWGTARYEMVDLPEVEIEVVLWVARMKQWG
jgi:hypothetical protein